MLCVLWDYDCGNWFAEIARVESGQDKDKYIELHNDKPLKLAVKVRVPVKEFPKVCYLDFFAFGGCNALWPTQSNFCVDVAYLTHPIAPFI